MQTHKIETQIDPNLPLVYLDSKMIYDVLSNLFENAAQYTPIGTKITIKAYADHKFLNVNFYDNGPGLPKGQEEAIFQKFTRGPFSKKFIEKPGIGLGLAVCRAIITVHNGIIKAAHAPTGRAAIIFSIPLSQENIKYQM